MVPRTRSLSRTKRGPSRATFGHLQDARRRRAPRRRSPGTPHQNGGRRQSATLNEPRAIRRDCAHSCVDSSLAFGLLTLGGSARQNLQISRFPQQCDLYSARCANLRSNSNRLEQLDPSIQHSAHIGDVLCPVQLIRAGLAIDFELLNQRSILYPKLATVMVHIVRRRVALACPRSPLT